MATDWIERFRNREPLIGAAVTFLASQQPRHVHDREPLVNGAMYRGHDIRVTTTFDVRVDGVPVRIPFTLEDNGLIGTHAIPFQHFRSMFDLVRALIDLFPREVGRQQRDAHGSDHTHPEHGTGAHHGGHAT